MTLTIDRSYRDAGPAPLYHRYPRESQPQSGIIEIAQDGTVSAFYDPILGSGVPEDVWRGERIWLRVPCTLSPEGIDRLLDEAMPLLERLYNRDYDQKQGDDPALDFDMLVDEIRRDPAYMANVWPAPEWVAMAWTEIIQEYRDASDADAFLESLRQQAAADGVVLVDLDELREEMDAALAEQE